MREAGPVEQGVGKMRHAWRYYRCGVAVCLLMLAAGNLLLHFGSGAAIPLLSLAVVASPFVVGLWLAVLYRAACPYCGLAFFWRWIGDGATQDQPRPDDLADVTRLRVLMKWGGPRSRLYPMARKCVHCGLSVFEVRRRPSNSDQGEDLDPPTESD